MQTFRVAVVDGARAVAGVAVADAAVDDGRGEGAARSQPFAAGDAGDRVAGEGEVGGGGLEPV